MKREAEAPLEEDSRSFKLRKKSLNPGLGEIYDPGLIPIKVKKKEPIEQGDSSPNDVSTATDAGPSSTPSSKWAKPQWNAPLPDIKLEERENIFGLKEEPTDPTEDTPPAGQGSALGSLFKKRKTPAGAAKGR